MVSEVKEIRTGGKRDETERGVKHEKWVRENETRMRKEVRKVKKREVGKGVRERENRRVEKKKKEEDRMETWY